MEAEVAETNSSWISQPTLERVTGCHPALLKWTLMQKKTLDFPERALLADSPPPGECANHQRREKRSLLRNIFSGWIRDRQHKCSLTFPSGFCSLKSTMHHRWGLELTAKGNFMY